MSIGAVKFYPGETATAGDMLTMAGEYRRAAETLLPTGRAGKPVSRSPYRLLAIHAIELYLNAFLLAAGHSSAEVRGLQHDFTARSRLACTLRLTLRKRTLAHLVTLSASREYLTARYDPTASTLSELNRLAASLAEVADKVSDHISRHALPPRHLPPTRHDPTASSRPDRSSAPLGHSLQSNSVPYGRLLGTGAFPASDVMQKRDGEEDFVTVT